VTTANSLKRNILAGAAGLSERRSLRVLRGLAAPRGLKVYLVGGSVRELALGCQSPDLDLAVSAQTLELARDLAAALDGTFVLLDEGERTARVVAAADILDLAEFRAPGLEGDLRGRDFTINAVALDLDGILGFGDLTVIDPLGGLEDLSRRLIRMVAAANLAADPLRLLRAYRFAATHGLELTAETEAAIRRLAPEFSRMAGERIHQELFLLLGAPQAGSILKQMDRAGLLLQIFPELSDMKGVEQDGYHHLDVFHHSLSAVSHLEEVLAAPPRFFGELAAQLARYAGVAPHPALLKLAALFHDAGKPKVQGRRTAPDRYTFYYHEKVGVETFTGVAQRLRLSAAETKLVNTLIHLHMRPFLLLPAFRQRDLSFRAMGRLVRAARSDLPGLFALAMADSLAGQGPLKPADAEVVLADLADEAYRFLREKLEPQEAGPRLLNGDDLIREFHLEPGPRFRHLLTAVQEAQWEGLVRTREDALRLVRGLLNRSEARDCRQ
jgi:poly(A) polymerase